MKYLGIYHFQECVVSNFECKLQEKYKFSANLVSCIKKNLGINVTSVLVIQVQVFIIFMRGFKNILHVTLNFIGNQRI